VILPANFSHVVEACIDLMRREGSDQFEVTDGDTKYRIELNVSAIKVEVSQLAQLPASDTPTFLRMIADRMEEARQS